MAHPVRDREPTGNIQREAMRPLGELKICPPLIALWLSQFRGLLRPLSHFVKREIASDPFAGYFINNDYG